MEVDSSTSTKYLEYITFNLFNTGAAGPQSKDIFQYLHQQAQSSLWFYSISFKLLFTSPSTSLLLLTATYKAFR